jgi:hypothetical protein
MFGHKLSQQNMPRISGLGYDFKEHGLVGVARATTQKFDE